MRNFSLTGADWNLLGDVWRHMLNDALAGKKVIPEVGDASTLCFLSSCLEFFFGDMIWSPGSTYYCQLEMREMLVFSIHIEFYPSSLMPWSPFFMTCPWRGKCLDDNKVVVFTRELLCARYHTDCCTASPPLLILTRTIIISKCTWAK